MSGRDGRDDPAVQTVHIERLVLEGIRLPHYARPSLVAALQEELGRLLAPGEGGLAPGLMAGASLRHLVTPSPAIDASAPPPDLGRQIARAVYAGIGGAPAAPDSQGGEA
jgi:hypothetical protein